MSFCVTSSVIRSISTTHQLRLVLLFLVLGFLLPRVSVAADVQSMQPINAVGWLDKMSHSFRELNYSGTLSFQQGERMESLRMAHAVIAGEEYERLDYLDGDQREIIRRGHEVNCIHTGHHLLRFYQHSGGAGSAGTKQASSIADLYRFDITGETRVAGRNAVQILVTPKDQHRFGYRLALDEATGLMLRSELIGSKGQVLERFQYVDITVGVAKPIEYFSDAGHSFKPQHAAPNMEVEASKSRLLEGWQVNWLPKGFTATVTGAAGVTSDMATFTDGLTVFSVFFEVASKSEQEGRAQRGATTAYSRTLLLAGHPHRVTVVGEIPARTAQQVATSVALVTQQ
ncbi:MucB/RseB C-terminal domain-containing protein [Oceanicoccus sp. KOV_DT_Chl]|uniref:MucB/RseB C-terminal domain-containing protein n=1 Tax=Oceanicoccus sp. KOV_DT_Chl TaxID=1904639 RepID=UPI000C7BF9A4|nr:MucB/RseB C-terminal domain-containing protein [Oceanicoccus sp. KOV_DT_Chl]